MREQHLKQLERRAWVLSLEGQWFACIAGYSQYGSTIWIRPNGSECVEAGMSGSPVITNNGKAMALVSTSGGDTTQGPGLIDTLPGWLLDITLGEANPRRRLKTSLDDKLPFDKFKAILDRIEFASNDGKRAKQQFLDALANDQEALQQFMNLMLQAETEVARCMIIDRINDDPLLALTITKKLGWELA